jgi:hypothetical protein
VRALLLGFGLITAVACGTTTHHSWDESEVRHVPRRPDPRRIEGAHGRDRGGPEASRPRGGPPLVARCEELLPLVRDIARGHEVDWSIIAAIVTVESKWTPAAKNRSGASGLMQVMPSTGRRLGCGELLDAHDNVACGARLLARLLGRYEGKVSYALAAYAAGARSVDAAFKAGRKPPKERFVSRITKLGRGFSEAGCEVLR